MVETALLLMVPTADRVVAPWRAKYDQAAQVGIPAHLTVAYPFKPDLSEDDLAALRAVAAAVAPFSLELTTTGWFGDDVVFLVPSDPTPFVNLARLIADAWPDWPLYGGDYDAYIPHLTIGHIQPLELLKAAEADVVQHLPIIQQIDAVELWQGSALTSGDGLWSRVETIPLLAS